MAKNNPLATIESETDTDMSLVGSGKFLRRFKLCAPLTAEVTDKLAAAGDYYLQGVENLGNEVEVVVVRKRTHALRLIENSTKVGAESFDPTSETFKEIQGERDSDPQRKEPNSSYGYDFLCWLPETQVFAVIFINKMALKHSAVAIMKAMGKGLHVLTSRQEPSKKNPKVKYDVPVITKAAGNDYTAPTDKQFAEAIEMFTNQKPQGGGAPAEQGPADGAGASKKGGRKGR